MRQKYSIALALTSLLIAGGVFVFLNMSKDNASIPLSGQLNAELGESKVVDGYYDIRIVSYDTTTGLLLSVQDFPDVQVDDAIYTIPYKLPSASDLSRIYYQLCRTGTSSVNPDGFDDAKLPVRCESLSQKDSSLPVVECPKTLVVTKQGSATSSYATPNCIEDESTVDNVDFAGSNTEKTAVASVFGERGPEGPKGDKGDQGEPGIPGTAGDPATDDQTITFGGASILSISGGNSVSLGSLLDNTDELASLACVNGEVPLMTVGVWACGTASGVDTDDQTLSLLANTLAIDNGNSINLAGYLDNTDSQTLSLAVNTLSLVNGGSVNLAPYLDNTDAQDLTIAGTTLSLTGDGTSVSLASLLDNTDVLASLSCGATQIPKWNGSAWACAADVDTVLNEAQVDSYVANNGYLTVEVDGSVSNELQNLTFASNVLGLTSSGVSFDLSAYLDNTDVLASLSCTNGQVAQWNGSAWICANVGVDTDDQTLSLMTNTLSIDSGNSVSLASYLDNTDAQSISVSSNLLSISGNASTVDLTPYLDNTDTQDLSLASNTLTLIAGGSVDLSPYLDNTDAQDLTLGGSTLSLSGDGTTVSLASFLDNTDVLAGLSCSNNQIPKWNGSVWACAADIDTVLDESQVDAYVANNGYLSVEVDGSVSNELQNLTFASNVIGLTSSGVTFDLSAYLDNTDAQDLSLAGNTLSLTGDGTSVNLAPYLDNTDTLASLSCSSNQIAKWNGSAWVCAADVDTDTDTQDLSLASNTLSLVAGGSVDLSAYLDNTDAQDLTIAGNTLSLTGDGTSVNLAGYLDNTDGQTLSLVTDTLSISGGNSLSLAGYLDNTDSQNLFFTIDAPNGTDPSADSSTDTLAFADGAGITITGNSTTDTLTIASVLGTTIDSSEIVDGAIVFADINTNGCTNNQIFKFNGSAWFCGTDVDTDTVLNESQVEAFIFDADNTGTLSNGTLALGSLSYTGTLGDTNVSDALTISSAGTVADGALSANVSLLGSSIDSSEITNGTVTGTDIASATILFSNIAQNGCASNDVMKWNGSAWACAVDVDTDTDAQNLFGTINADNGTDPVADTSTDTLNLVSGSGVTITGDGTTDTITVASTLGTDITGAEIVDGTIANGDLANSSLTVTAGTGLTGGGAVSLGGTVTLNAALGTDIVTGEIVNGTILTADIAADQITSALIANGEIVNADIADTTITNAKLVNSAITVTAGTGLSGGGSVALGSSVSLTATLGTDVDTSEITNGTILFADIASNSCGSGQVIEYNGSAWVCGTDDGITSEVDGSTTNELQNIFETISTPAGTNPVADGTTDTLSFANGNGVTITGNGTTDTITIAATLGTDIDSSEIVDGTVANGDLANSSVTINTGTGLSGGGSVALGGTLNLTSSLGTDIDTGEIVNGTIVLADFSDFGCGTNQIIKYNGSAWVCAADAGLTSEVDGSTTNELQNIFQTIATPDINDPSADSTTDTLTLANGAGVSITSNGTTDTITIATTLGTTIDSSEIVDGTVTGTDISDGSVGNTELANSSLTVTAGTGLTGGGAVSLGGTVTLNLANDFGASIDSGEITNGTIAFADLGQNSCGTNDVIKWNGSAWACAADLTGGSVSTFETFNADNGTDPVADSATDTLNYTSGAGVTVTGDSTTDTITIAAVLGATIDSSSEIVDGVIANVDLVNSSLTVTAGNGLANGGSVALGASTTLNIGAGNGVTVNADDIAVQAAASADGLSSTTSSGSGLEVLATGVTLLQGCSNNQILKWNETTDVWVCSADVDTDAQDLSLSVNTLSLTNDGSTVDLSGYLDNTDSQFLFLTFDVDNGTDPAADTATDTLTWVSGAGVTLTGNSTTDTITVAATLGDTIDNSSEIVDGTIANADLANSGVTLVAGSGLVTGGAISLGGTVTLDVGAGTGLTVNANDIQITDDGLNFTQLSDTLSLDAATTISLGANNLTTNLNGTGDYAIQFGGNTVLQILDTGAVTLGNILADQTIGIDNGTGVINIATDTDANTTNIGTGTGADTVTIGDANANVSLTDAQWSISGAGAASFASLTGSGLTDCDQSDDTLKWDAATSQFSCGTNRATFHNVLDGNYTNNTATMTDVDADADAADDIGFAIGANETWVFEMWVQYNSPTAADSQWQVTAPAGATCEVQYLDIENGNTVANLGCGATTGNQATLALDDTTVLVGVVTTGATAGNVMLQFRQNAASGSSTIFSGSYITAYRTSGADLAETYFTQDYALKPGMIAKMSGNGASQIERANQSYNSNQIGIISTSPGSVLGEADGVGKPLPVALSGRVPVRLTTENGLPRAGDMVTASDTLSGYGMRATNSGYIVGQLLLDAKDNGDGTADGFVYVRHGYWQAPISINLSDIFGDSAAMNLTDLTSVLGATAVTTTEYSSLDQAAVDEILRGFSIQQGQINDLATQINQLTAQIGASQGIEITSDVAQSVTFIGNVEFAGFVSYNPSTTGTVTIPAGQIAYQLLFDTPHPSIPKIFISTDGPIDGVLWRSDVTRDGFKIYLSQPQSRDISVDWFSAVSSQ